MLLLLHIYRAAVPLVGTTASQTEKKKIPLPHSTPNNTNGWENPGPPWLREKKCCPSCKENQLIGRKFILDTHLLLFCHSVLIMGYRNVILVLATVLLVDTSSGK